MSFRPLSDAAVAALRQEQALRRRAEAADSMVALCKARERMAGWVAARIDDGAEASPEELARALEVRASATLALQRSRGARHLLLSRLVRTRGRWKGVP